MTNQTEKMALLKSELNRFFKFFLSELKPKGKIVTPFNIIAAVITPCPPEPEKTILERSIMLFLSLQS